MARSPSFCGVILAAGESSRMGRDKALLPWPPGPAGRSTFLSATIELLQAPSDMVIVVAGKNADSLRPIVDAAAGYLVVNPHPERGQFSSLQVGLQEVLNHGRDAAMVALVDNSPGIRSGPTPVGCTSVKYTRHCFQRAATRSGPMKLSRLWRCPISLLLSRTSV